jgi:glutamate--cysteine ligase
MPDSAQSTEATVLAGPPDDPEIVPHREAAEAFVTRICFKIGPPKLVGLELEWLVHDRRKPASPLSPARLAAALGPWCPPALHDSLPPSPAGWPWSPPALRSPPAPAPTPATMPNGSAVTVEPGGQVEISTRPAASLADCLADAAADARLLDARVSSAGLALLGAGADPHRSPTRLLDVPRYAAMEAHFDRRSSSGRTMMCATAAVQPSLDAGQPAGADSFVDRWHTLHATGPALLAMFANSPVLAGRPTGWKSARQAAWLDIDPSRTTAPPPAADPREAYARYALDAPLLCIRRDGASWSAPPGLTFAEWIAGAMAPAPTFDDLAYHLTTLFPPVRATGHFEVRYLDAQPGDGWVVPAAVVWALIATPAVRERARAAVEAVAGRWVDAARFGMSDIALGVAARRLAEVALDGLAGQPDQITERVTAFAERYTLRGRGPADDWETL